MSEESNLDGLIGWILIGSIVISLWSGSWIPFLIGMGLTAILETYKYLVSTWKENYAKCPHGIRGGLTQKQCPICVRDEEIKLEQIQRDFEEKERLSEIRANAKQLQLNEIRRLTEARLTKLEGLTSLSPQEFEDAVAAMYSKLGYEVSQTPYSNDRGKDAILFKGGDKYLVECKKYGHKNRVGRPHLQKFYAAIQEEEAVRGFFITTGIMLEQLMNTPQNSKLIL